MILPELDDLVLPETDDGAIVVDPTTEATALSLGLAKEALVNLLPAAFRGGDLVDRDAVLAMLAAVSNEQWARSAFVLEATQSPRFAAGVGLDYWGFLKGRPRAPAELDPSYRARLLAHRDVISPTAIKTAVNAQVALFKNAKVAYLEPGIDAAFCTPASTADAVVINSNNDPASSTYAGQAHGVESDWMAFTQPVAGQSTENQTVVAGVTARLLSEYPDDIINPQSPSYVTPLTTGAVFWIITSGDLTNDGLTPHAAPIDTGADEDAQFQEDYDFVAPATTTDAVVLHSNNDSTEASYANQAHGIVPTWAGYSARAGWNLGDLIIAEVEARRGGGVSYMVLFDPYLGAAI